MKFCEDIAEKYPNAVLLMDWDDKGEKLFRALAEGLHRPLGGSRSAKGDNQSSLPERH